MRKQSFTSLLLTLSTTTIGFLVTFNPNSAAPSVQVLEQEAELLKRTSEFRKVERLKDIPDSVKKELWPMAEPGQRWNGGCNWVEGLPQTRFVCGFLGEKRCWVIYETGGFGGFWNHALLYSLADTKGGSAAKLWAGNHQKLSSVDVESVDAFQKWISKQAKFTAANGPEKRE